MDKLRLRFSKTGRAIYISHLDLMHTLQRAFSRAGYRIRYSEGFNPHPYISIALPLSVCMSSVCEILDFRLIGDADLAEMPAKLNAALPEGIEVSKVYEGERKCAEIKWLEVKGIFEYDRLSPEDAAVALTEFYSQDRIIILKKSKRGTAETDIRPMIRSIDFRPAEGGCELIAVVSAQEPTLNPELLADALRQLKPELAPDFSKFTRLEVYDSGMNIFR